MIQCRDIEKQLREIYRVLHKTYGPQHWWPGDTPFEVMVGAVLTQNAAWGNVEKAISNLKRAKLLTPSRLHDLPLKRLASLIRPSGYYNIKARRLRNLLDFIADHYQGSLHKMFREDPAKLRHKLLEVNGIGRETADSILLYAAGKPFFVVDAYTKRILYRHGLLVELATAYHEVQRLFMDGLDHNPQLFNEYHALMVRLGKERCKKNNPLCSGCPLENFHPIRL